MSDNPTHAYVSFKNGIAASMIPDGEAKDLSMRWVGGHVVAGREVKRMPYDEAEMLVLGLQSSQQRAS